MSSLQSETVVFQGRSLWVRWIEGHLAELCFDRQGESTNKFDRVTVEELSQAAEHIAALPGLRGVLISSAKDVFVVGADINEFMTRFDMNDEELTQDVRGASRAFVAIEDLPVPTVAAINGYALGGGLELALACSLRVMSSMAQVGLPEVTLGLIPGAGGNVRLPRIAGTPVAIEWIGSGKARNAEAALAAHVVDDVCTPSDLRDTALRLLRRCAAGEVDWKERRQIKWMPMVGDPATREQLFAQALQTLQSQAESRPATSAAVDLMRRCATLGRDAALSEELRIFVGIIKTPAAGEMVRAFLDEQQARRLARRAQATSAA